MSVITSVPMVDAETNAGNEKLIRDKIRHTLSVYPRISMSMLQIGMGTSLSASIWKPVLRGMIEAGEVVEEQLSAVTPSNRAVTYTILSLAKTSTPTPAITEPKAVTVTVDI